jgi:hypothetical protein
MAVDVRTAALFPSQYKGYVIVAELRIIMRR